MCFFRKGEKMKELLSYLEEFNFASVVLRLFLAMVCGGLLGLERKRKHRPADARTYMMVCMGAALTMLIGEYEYNMMNSWRKSTSTQTFPGLALRW